MTADLALPTFTKNVKVGQPPSLNIQGTGANLGHRAQRIHFAATVGNKKKPGRLCSSSPCIAETKSRMGLVSVEPEKK